ncbi:MAG: lecithin retinol acyltransferase family protein [Gammaproteobacteria bacterium]
MPKKNCINLSDLKPGKVIAIQYSLYKHFAIISDCFDNGMPKLISLSFHTSGVQEETWHNVVGDHPIEESYIKGNYTKEVILARARSCFSKDIKYNLFTFNCEHFARYAHGLPVESIQVKRAIYGAALGAASCALLPKLTIARFVIATTVGATTSLKNSLSKI